MGVQKGLGFAINEDDDIDQLQELVDLVDHYKLLKHEIDAKQEEIDALKKAFNRVSMEEIPNILHSNGLSEIKLATGEKVVVKDDINITVDSPSAFHGWLRDRGEDDIVKLTMAFDKMESNKRQALIGFLLEGDYTYDADNKIHWQTQKSYFKNLLGIGKKDYADGLQDGRYMQTNKLPSFVKIFPYNKTTVK